MKKQDGRNSLTFKKILQRYTLYEEKNYRMDREHLTINVTFHLIRVVTKNVMTVSIVGASRYSLSFNGTEKRNQIEVVTLTIIFKTEI